MNDSRTLNPFFLKYNAKIFAELILCYQVQSFDLFMRHCLLSMYSLISEYFNIFDYAHQFIWKSANFDWEHASILHTGRSKTLYSNVRLVQRTNIFKHLFPSAKIAKRLAWLVSSSTTTTQGNYHLKTLSCTSSFLLCLLLPSLSDYLNFSVSCSFLFFLKRAMHFHCFLGNVLFIVNE